MQTLSLRYFTFRLEWVPANRTLSAEAILKFILQIGSVRYTVGLAKLKADEMFGKLRWFHNKDVLACRGSVLCRMMFLECRGSVGLSHGR